LQLISRLRIGHVGLKITYTDLAWQNQLCVKDVELLRL